MTVMASPFHVRSLSTFAYDVMRCGGVILNCNAGNINVVSLVICCSFLTMERERRHGVFSCVLCEKRYKEIIIIGMTVNNNAFPCAVKSVSLVKI